MVMDKKGQEMSITTLLLIVLGLVVVVVVIIGFVYGWKGLAEKINIFQPSTNIDSLVSACNLAISSPGGFCEFKQATIDGKTQYVNCDDLRIKSKLDSGASPSCVGYEDRVALCKGKSTDVMINGDDTCAKYVSCKTDQNCIDSKATVNNVAYNKCKDYVPASATGVTPVVAEKLGLCKAA